MEVNTNKTRAYSALFYLITRLVKEQKGLLITILVFSIILALLPIFNYWIIKNNHPNEEIIFSNWELKVFSGFFGWVTWVPPLLTCLAILPILHRQIFDSSILKRLKASGISAVAYSVVMIGSFALISTVMFWTLSIITQPIYASMYGGYQMQFKWLTFIFVTPIIWVAFASTGVLIGNWQIPEVLKGILIFFIFGIITVFSSTIMTPEILNIYPIAATKYEAILLGLNPWALMINTVHHSIVDTESSSYATYSVLISIMISSLLFLIAINRISLR